MTQQVFAKKQASWYEQSLSLAVEIAELGIFSIDLKTSIATFSQQAMEWFGLEQPALPMTEVFSRIHYGDQAIATKTIERSIAGERGGRHDFVYRVLHPKTGTIQYLRSIGQVTFEDDVPVSISGIIQDVTKDRIANKKIEESEQYARSLFYNSPVAVLVYVGQEMVLREANEKMLEIFCRGDEIIDKPIMEVIPELNDTP